MTNAGPIAEFSATLVAAWPHLLVLPIVLPLAAGALLLLVERRWPRAVVPLALAAVVLLLATSLLLFVHAGSGRVEPYLLGNWRAPFGIALALDRLAALMLLLTAVVALAALLQSLAGDAARGPHFHSLLQFLLMGLNGAFLTADLFNLFVFFEVLLAASYGLLLHGEGAGRRQRLRAGLHMVVFNLCGSALFLFAVSLLYAVTGTLNMADLALKFAQLPPQDQRLAHAAALLLLVVFAVKAALLPLYFWLPDAYAAATAPAAALFAVLTKVGVYAVARTTSLIFGSELASPALPLLALATLALAAVGVLAAERMRALVAYLVVGSAGTLLLAIGLGGASALAAGLFYLPPSTLVAALLFLVVERIAEARAGNQRGSDAATALPLAGRVAGIGALFFIAAAGVAGLPPLAGFIGKALLLQAAGVTAWGPAVVAVVLGSSLAVTVALARCGSVVFWQAPRASLATSHHPRTPAAVQAASGWLLAALLGCAVAAGPLADYTRATAAQLLERRSYIDAVFGAAPAPPAWDVRREMRERGAVK